MDSVLALLNLHKTGRLFWRLALDRRVPWSLKIYAVAGLVYFFSPLDVVPHDFTGIGLVDDIIVALVIMQALIEMAPEDVVDEHCERLSIDPRHVFTPVPVIIRDAMDLFFTGRGMRPGQMRHDEPDHDYPPRRGRQARAEREEPPPFSRYSAYREDD